MQPDPDATTRALNAVIDEADWDRRLREAVQSGHVDPDGVPSLAESLHHWARFVAAMEPVDREVAVSERIAVMAPLHANAEQLLRAALAAADRDRRQSGAPQTSTFIDWSSFWDREHSNAEWTYDDVLARGRGHAIYATHKTGKSLLTLWIAAQVCMRPDHACLYLDYEMTEADLYDRLDDMGYGPYTDFSRLRYALLPSLPPLDTREGADAAMELVGAAVNGLDGVHLTVVIDTMSRAVKGEENDADTFRNFYNHTGIRLKREGLTWVRLDHAGKDSSRGQRGSSSKGDDVDVIWKMSKTEHGLELKREASRMSWVPERVMFKRSDNPLNYLRVVNDWPEGTKETALHLDRLHAPVETTVKDAGKLLKDHGVGVRTTLVSAAVRWRKQRAEGRDS